MTNKFGLCGTLHAQTGQGETLAQILLNAAKLMEKAKGCHLYIVTVIANRPDSVYVIEVWDSKDDHDQSLQIPGVSELIAQARPILAAPPEGLTLNVVGGTGLY